MRSMFLVLLPLVLQHGAAHAEEPGWQFQLTPYVWLPTISGNLNYGPDAFGPTSAQARAGKSG